LEGLKENVIVGRLIPAGTGGMISRLRTVATRRDDLILQQQASQQAPTELEPQPAANAAE
ncbi:MAG: hypothetical protein J0H41_15670, partial [Rhizobiales bacterium]|nr:hypothetical protein [Hyphomicrobiales bacterium]